jgi:addiction module RelE/StbE family toxin
MIIERHPIFIKAFKKRISRDVKLVNKFEKRLDLFLKNPHNPLLRDHSLIGAMRGYRSFSVTADIRVIYYQKDETVAVFYDIGTHNQVY